MIENLHIYWQEIIAAVATIMWFARLEFKQESIAKELQEKNNTMKELQSLLKQINDRLIVIETLVSERTK